MNALRRFVVAEAHALTHGGEAEAMTAAETEAAGAAARRLDLSAENVEVARWMAAALSVASGRPVTAIDVDETPGAPPRSRPLTRR